MLFVLFTVFPAFVPEKAAAAGKFADGEYSIPFTVLKDTGNEQSTTADYMVSPAKVIVQNDKTYVVVTLNNSSWWQYFKVQSGGGFADVQVLSNDTANDKRVVKFEVNDIDQLVNAKIHIIVSGIPGFSYDNKYDIRFKFSSSNIPLAPVAEKPTPAPTPKPAVTPTEKPAEKITEKKQETVAKPEKKPTTEEKSTESNLVVNEKSDPKEEVGIEPDKSTEQLEDEEEIEVEPIQEMPEEMDSEGTEEEKTSELTEEAIAAESESDSKTSPTTTILIVIFTLLILGGLIFFVLKKRSRTQG